MNRRVQREEKGIKLHLKESRRKIEWVSSSFTWNVVSAFPSLSRRWKKERKTNKQTHSFQSLDPQVSSISLRLVFSFFLIPFFFFFFWIAFPEGFSFRHLAKKKRFLLAFIPSSRFFHPSLVLIVKYIHLFLLVSSLLLSFSLLLSKCQVFCTFTWAKGFWKSSEKDVTVLVRLKILSGMKNSIGSGRGSLW